MSNLAAPSLPRTGRSTRVPLCLPQRKSPHGEQSRRDDRAIRRGFSWLAAGNIVNVACGWGRLALLARLGNAEMVGQLTLALAICNPISTLADLGLCSSLISDAARQFSLRDYLGLRAITCVLTLLFIVGTAWTGGYDAAGARLILLAGLLVTLESACDIFQAVLQREERMHWVAISLIVRGIVGLALFAVALATTRNLAWGVCGFAVAAVMTLVAIDIPAALGCEKRKANSQGAMSAKSLSRLAWLSLPLGLATASLSLTASIPRYWISARLGDAALGGFAVAGSLMIALSLVVGALSQTACPRLARYHAEGNQAAFRRLLGWLSLWLLAATVLSVAVMVVAGRWVIGLLFGPAFVPYASIATCLMLAAGLRNFSILLGRAITSMRRFRMGLVLRLLGIAVLAAMLPGWIGWLGLMGAAWAVTISWLVTTVLSLAVVLGSLAEMESGDILRAGQGDTKREA